MASIVLTAVGTAVGGPVGGMIGNIVGRQLDQMVFGYPGRRVEGRRLEDLSVQLSSYGQDIPRLYGHGRVAGNIIWSTGLIETRHEDRQSTGGKGSGPKVTQVTYRYAASFAVACSIRYGTSRDRRLARISTPFFRPGLDVDVLGATSERGVGSSPMLTTLRLFSFIAIEPMAACRKGAPGRWDGHVMSRFNASRVLMGSNFDEGARRM